jgi:hypothetical protein
VNADETTDPSSAGATTLPPPVVTWPDATVMDAPPPDRPPRPRQRRERLELRELRGPLRAALVVAVVWATALPGSPARSVGLALCLGVVGGAAVLVANRSARSAVLGACAIAFLPWLAIRHSPWLLWVDITVFGILLLHACAAAPGPGEMRSALTFVRRTLAIWRSGWDGPGVAGRVVLHGRGDTRAPIRRLVHLARTAMIPLLITLTCVALLASGDALFASYLDVGWAVDSAASRIGYAVLGSVGFVWLLGTAHAPPPTSGARRHRSTRSVVLTLVGLAITIGAYGATQMSAAIFGAHYVESRTGLTYADYARSGFFQLVAVAAIAATAVTMARPVLDAAAQRRTVILLAGLVTTGVVTIVASSVVKLAVYTDRFGLTMLRLYTSVFAVWVGLVVLLTFAALVHRRRDWLVPVVLSTIVIGAFAINVANPERIVAEHNLARAREHRSADRVSGDDVSGDDVFGDLDVAYLGRLSADAAPTILVALAALDEPDRAQLAARWCAGTTEGGFGWNLAARRAAQARTDFCR